LKLNYDEPLSFFAFKFNVRRYSMDASLSLDAVLFHRRHPKAGRCWLPASKPVFKAPMVSALETTI
jgi:hypothetical protein